MLDLRCPSCSQTLTLRLLTTQGPCSAFCEACEDIVSLEFLESHGIPADLVQQLKEWGVKTPPILYVGRVPAEKGGLGDREYVRIWRQVYDKTQALVARLRTYLITHADLLKVFDRYPADQWTDEEIVHSRRWMIRLHLITEYGRKIAERYMEDGGTLPKEAVPLPVPFPKELTTGEERDSFTLGFVTQAVVWDTMRLSESPDYRRVADELADLERQLGIEP